MGPVHLKHTPEENHSYDLADAIYRLYWAARQVS